MTPATIAAHVTRLCGVIWWRKVVERIGRAGAVLILVAAPLSVVLLYAWAWGQVADVVSTLAAQQPLVELAIPALLLGFVMVGVILRVALLAFDFVAPDLRLLLDTAPLTRVAKAMIQVVPDFLASSALSIGIGSVALTSFAFSTGRMAVAAVIILCLATVALVGMVAALLEWLLSRLTKDVTAARSGAAAGLLLLVCAMLLLLTGQLKANGLDLPLVRGLGRLLMQDQLLVSAGGLVSAGVFLAAWGWFGSRITITTFQAGRRPPVFAVPGGRIAGVSGAFLWRDPANRLGAMALLAVGMFGVALESLASLPVAWPMIALVSIMAIGAASLYAYGEFLTIRWRVVASPAGPRPVLLRWILGHWVAGWSMAIAVAVPGVLLAWVIGADFASEWWTPFLGATLAAMGTSVLAGRIVPYERDDVLGLAGCGTVSTVLFALSWFVLVQLPPLAMLPAAVAVVIGCLALVLFLEPRATADR